MPQTAGVPLRRPYLYDVMVKVLTLRGARAIRERTVALGGVRSGERVLDVGCGTGDLTMLAAKAVGQTGEAWGVDVSPEMIAFARQKATRAGVGVGFQVGLIEALPFSDARFDVVLSSLMMHHLPLDLQQRGLAEIRRVLRPGGRLLIVDFQRPTAPHGRLSLTFLHHRRLDRGVQDLPTLLVEAGFERVEVGDVALFGLGYASGQTEEPQKPSP